MVNDHSLGRALNIDLLYPDFMEAVSRAWCRETCWPGCVSDYPANRDDNPSFGNCLVTTLAAWADRGFLDKVIGGKVNETAWHFRLSADGRVWAIDPTWQQFDQGSRFRALSRNTPEERMEYREVITGSLEDESLLPRLTILLEKMREQSGYDVGYSADYIIGRLKQAFSFVHAPDFVFGPTKDPQP